MIDSFGVDGESGLLVDPESHNQVGRSITRLIADRKLATRLGASARSVSATHTYRTTTWPARKHSRRGSSPERRPVTLKLIQRPTPLRSTSNPGSPARRNRSVVGRVTLQLGERRTAPNPRRHRSPNAPPKRPSSHAHCSRTITDGRPLDQSRCDQRQPLPTVVSPQPDATHDVIRRPGNHGCISWSWQGIRGPMESVRDAVLLVAAIIGMLWWVLR